MRKTIEATTGESQHSVTSLRRVWVVAAALMATAGCSAEDGNDTPVTSSPPGATAEAGGGHGGGGNVVPNTRTGPQGVPEFRFVRENGRELLTACRADVVVESGKVAVTAEIESTGELEGGRVVLSYLGNPQDPTGAFWLNAEAAGGDWTPNQTNTVQLDAPLPAEFANGDPFNVHVTYLPANAPSLPANSNPVESWAQWSTGMSQEEVLELYSFHIAGCWAEGSVANQQNL